MKAIPLDVGLDFAIPLGLLVTELVTTSLKHAFPTGGGAVEVVLDRTQDGRVVAGRRRQRPGLWRGRTALNSGLGARIIRGLVAQPKGVITVSNHGGSRTEVAIEEPAYA